MGWQARATVARLNNLAKPVNPQNPTIEEVPDDEDMDFEDEDYLEHGFFFLDQEPTSEEDSDLDGFDTDEEVDEGELKGLENKADIAHFNAVLAHAQAMAIKAEREAAGEKPKRKWHYMGNSVCTKWHHTQKHQELAATGQKLISSMFMKKVTESTPMEEKEGPPDAIGIADDSDSSDEGDDEIETSLKQLFPGEHEVSVLWSMKNKWILLNLTRPLAVNQTRTHHILPRVMVLLLLKWEKKLKYYFKTFTKADIPKTTVLKQLQISS